jgi:hypothetical protein
MTGGFRLCDSLIFHALRNYAQRSFGVFQENPVDVVQKFAPKAAVDAREFLFHPTQVMEPQRVESLIVLVVE